MNNKIKLQYKAPELSIIVFETADIIATSGGPFDGEHESLVLE